MQTQKTCSACDISKSPNEMKKGRTICIMCFNAKARMQPARVRARRNATARVLAARRDKPKDKGLQQRAMSQLQTLLSTCNALMVEALVARGVSQNQIKGVQASAQYQKELVAMINRLYRFSHSQQIKINQYK